MRGAANGRSGFIHLNKHSVLSNIVLDKDRPHPLLNYQVTANQRDSYVDNLHCFTHLRHLAPKCHLKGKYRVLKEFKDLVNKIATRTGKAASEEENEIAITQLKSLIPFVSPVFCISFLSTFSKTRLNYYCNNTSSAG